MSDNILPFWGDVMTYPCRKRISKLVLLSTKYDATHGNLINHKVRCYGSTDSFRLIPFSSWIIRFARVSETEMSSFWWNFHHWLHWKLSKWQLPVQPVIKISSKWRHFRFSGIWAVFLTIKSHDKIARFLVANVLTRFCEKFAHGKVITDYRVM